MIVRITIGPPPLWHGDPQMLDVLFMVEICNSVTHHSNTQNTTLITVT